MIDYIYFQGKNGQTVTLNDDTYPLTMFDMQIETATQENNRPADHGLFPTFSYMGKRTIHMEGDIFGSDSTDFLRKRVSLLGAFVPAPELGYRASGTLVIKFTGQDEAVQCDCYPDGLPVAPLEALSPARGTFVVSLNTFDPVLYGTNVQTVRSGTPGGGGGFTFPITFPLNFTLGSGGSGDVQVNNTGNVSVYPTVTIYGPCTSPQLTLHVGTHTYTIALDNLKLNAGESVTLDFKAHTVVSSTLGSAYSLLRPGSIWFAIPPGTWLISYTAFQAASPSRAEISFRNGYML